VPSWLQQALNFIQNAQSSLVEYLSAADRKLQLHWSCEVLREAGILLMVLYPLERALPGRSFSWFWLVAIEVFAVAAVVCGIIFDKGGE
jgi:hypothetical protein